MSDDKKEEVQEESLERRITRRQERREHRIETIIPDDRFTKTSDFVGAIITGELVAEKITGVSATNRVEQTKEPRLFGDRRPIIERERQVSPIVDRGEGRPQTNIIDLTDHVVHEFQWLIDSSKRGVCSRIAVRSSNVNFSVSVIIDGQKQFNRTYEQFVTISPSISIIDAYTSQVDDLYILEIGELNWLEECQAILRVTENITFNTLFVNMKEYLV